MKKILVIIGIVITAFIAMLLVKTLVFQSKQPVSNKEFQDLKIDKNVVEKHLSEALKFKTISYDNNFDSSRTEFIALHNYLESSFPLFHKSLEKEILNDYTLFYTWKGKNPNLQPILFSGHLDVVSAEENNWIHSPFSGYIDDKYIWGRGTLDNKGIVISMMEAVEELIKDGFQPERTICFVFTHDEEIGGINGTSSVAELFQSKNMKFKYIMDEGGMITSGIIPGISVPVAMIGTAEKGAVSIELKVAQTGGTSAVPPKQTSIGILCEAINKLESNQFPMKIEGATKQMFEYLGPEMKFPNKLVFSNLWLFNGVVINQLSKSSSLSATLKTTTAVTIFNSGIKSNIIPPKATAVVNFRIIQGDSIEKVVQHVEQTINDTRVSIRPIGNSVEPSPVSDTKADGFQDISEAIMQVFPEIMVTPYLWTGGTNSKHFVKYADNIYRFSPVFIDKANMSSIHGKDEKISIDNLLECVMFYKQLIFNSSK